MQIIRMLSIVSLIFNFQHFRFKTTTDKTIQRLMIQTVRISDAGEYSVVAGGSVAKATLTVEGKDVQISEPAEKDISVIIF